MAFYAHLGIGPTAEVQEIWEAGEKTLKDVSETAVMDDLVHRCGMDREKALKHAPTLVKEARAHICRVTRFLTDPASREVYDAWRTASTPQQKILTNARIRHLNAHRGTNGIGLHNDFLFPETGASWVVRDNPTQTPKQGKPPFQCRYCPRHLKEDEMTIIKCACTARIGHPDCTRNFVREYNSKCPVCRDTMCSRKQVSKYLFWNQDERWTI